MSLLRSKPRLLVGLATVAAASAVAIKFGRWHILPKRFAIVEPGRLYRSGQLERWPYERVVKNYRIRTILSLNALPPEDRSAIVERQVVRRYGLRFIRLPMPGNGCGSFEALDAAAAVLADPANHPVLVHCAAGVNRTNAAIAAYRMKTQGWSFAEAMAECERYGLSRRRNPEFYRHMQAYYERLGKVRPTSRPATRPSQTRPSVNRAARHRSLKPEARTDRADPAGIGSPLCHNRADKPIASAQGRREPWAWCGSPAGGYNRPDGEPDARQPGAVRQGSRATPRGTIGDARHPHRGRSD